MNRKRWTSKKRFYQSMFEMMMSIFKIIKVYCNMDEVFQDKNE